MKLLHNAHIHTQNTAQPTASAIVIDRERILAFVERVLTAERFSPAMADEFFDT